MFRRRERKKNYGNDVVRKQLYTHVSRHVMFLEHFAHISRWEIRTLASWFLFPSKCSPRDKYFVTVCSDHDFHVKHEEKKNLKRTKGYHIYCRQKRNQNKFIDSCIHIFNFILFYGESCYFNFSINKQSIRKSNGIDWVKDLC